MTKVVFEFANVEVILKDGQFHVYNAVSRIAIVSDLYRAMAIALAAVEKVAA